MLIWIVDVPEERGHDFSDEIRWELFSKPEERWAKDAEGEEEAEGEAEEEGREDGEGDQHGVPAHWRI